MFTSTVTTLLSALQPALSQASTSYKYSGWMRHGLRGSFGFRVLVRVGGAFGLASAPAAFHVSAAPLAVTHMPNRR